MWTRLILAQVLLCLLLALSNAKTENRTPGPSHFKDNPIWDQSTMFTGPRKQIEVTNEMPEKTKVRRLLKLARSHDANGDDIIQVEELSEWLLEAYSIWDYQEVRDSLMKVDGNRDGKVTITEFLAQRHEGKTEKDAAKLEKKRKKGNTLSPEDEQFLRTVNDDMKRFATADLNKDHTLDETEFTMTVHPAEYPAMVDLDMKVTMEFGDVDKNGIITMDEFVNEDAAEDARRVAVDKFFELDANRDGSLSFDEMRRYILPNNADAKHKEVKSLMERADKDKDNQITIDELLAADGDFLFSPITDYARNMFYVKDEKHPEDEENEHESDNESDLKSENDEAERSNENGKDEMTEKSNEDEEKSQVKDKSKNESGKKEPDVKKTSSGKEKTSSEKDKTSIGKEKTSSGKEKSSSGKEKTSSEKDKTSSGKEKTSSGKEKTSSGKEKSSSGKEKTKQKDKSKANDKKEKSKGENKTKKTKKEDKDKRNKKKDEL